MAKRRADLQITQDNPGWGDSSSGEDEEKGKQASLFAAPEVLAKRKIAVPRRRQGPDQFGDSGPAVSQGSSNPFSVFSKPEAPKFVPFAFLSKSADQTETSSFRQPSGHSNAQLRLRGLNATFADQIAKAAKTSPFEDWSGMCNRYISYIQQIGVNKADEKADPGKSTTNTLSAKNVVSEEPKAPEKSQISSSGFKFGGASTASSTSFQFGDKKVEIKKTHQSTPSGGFVFNPSGTGEIKFAPSAAQNSTSADASLMNDSSSDSSDSDSKPKPHLKADSKAVTKSDDMSFDDSKSQDTSKPSFSFGNKPATDSISGLTNSKPASDLSAAATSKPAEAPKATFSFGKANTETGTSLFGSNSKPAFTFGAKPATNEAPKFSFGSTNQTTTNSSAGSTNSSPKPKFSFGNPTEANSVPSNSLPSNQSESKPAFTFSSTSSNASAPTTDSKPSFSFGKPSSDTKPTFSFGNPGANKSGFSFGKTVNPFSTANTSGTDGGKIDATWSPGSSIKIAEEPAAPSKAGASESNEPSETQDDPQTDLGGPGPGEENEDCLYEKRAKAHELVKTEEDGVPKAEYKLLGLGMLRVLKHKETGKVRALLRAEGSGRVLLNIPIRKEFSYTVAGKGQVKLLDVKPGNDAPTVYLVRVKTEDDSNELQSKLEQNKS